MQHDKNTVYLDSASWVEITPTFWQPQTNDEKIAAIVGYNTGDGNLTVTETHCQAGFYAKSKNDVQLIADDIQSLGYGFNAQVRLKKSREGLEDMHQLHMGREFANLLSDRGAPIGRKTMSEFSVPEWVMSGEANVKRAYIAALFGAEGSTPSKNAGAKSRMPKQPVLNMCKVHPISGRSFFGDLASIMNDLGVDCSLTETKSKRFGKSYTTYWLRVMPNPENLVRFFRDVGYLYASDKMKKAWLWMQYIKCYISERDRRTKAVTSMAGDKKSWSEIGAEIGLSRGAAHRLYTSIKDGKSATAGHSFPRFEDWVSERWMEEKNLLRVKVAKRSYKPSEMVWNMSVSSPDHSYILASGVNNFNCFETMSNRVYHAFDRNIHVRRVTYDPSLPIIVGMDFNITPMSAILMQERDGKLYVFDEIILTNSNTSEMAEELERRHWRRKKQIKIFPDPAGKSKSTSSVGESDFSILKSKGFGGIVYRRKHPRIKDRVNAVNRMLMSGDGTVRLYIDHSCKNLIRSFEQTQYKKNSTDIDKSAGMEHATDAIGYPIELKFPVKSVKVMGVSV